MRENASRAADRMLAHEGGYVNHPHDPGGATNLGVTIGTLKRLGIDKDGDGDSDIVDLKALTKDDARKVFKAFYWDTVKGDLLPPGVDYAVADFAYNSGPDRAARHLQKVVGTKQDGAIGTITLAAVDEAVAEMGAAWIVREVCDSRMKFLRGLGTWSSFGTGWTRRVNQVRAIGIEWANEKPAITGVTEMNGTKPIWQSKGVIGSVIAGVGLLGGFSPIITTIFAARGVEVPPEIAGEMAKGIESLLAGIGVVLAGVGRVTADRKIGK